MGRSTDALAEIDSGYSGNPLSIIPFRPDVSVESWAYIYDANKQSKVNSANAVRAVGVAPPNAAPAAEYGIPAWVQVADGQSDFGAGPTSGAATALNNGDRQSRASNTIGDIIYNSGNDRLVLPLSEFCVFRRLFLGWRTDADRD